MNELSFWTGGGIAAVAALLAVTRRNPVASVLWLVVAFLGLSALFVGMDAGFIAVIQILVYAGAIMVLFLFVIMLLRLSPSGMARIDVPQRWALGMLSAAGVASLIGAVAWASPAWNERGTPEAIRAANRIPAGAPLLSGDVGPLSNALFSDHVVPFEVTSVLLLVAIVGAVALTKRKV